MTNKPSDLKSHIGFHLRTLSNAVSFSFARKLDQSGVTVAEWVILREMFTNQKSTTPSSVAALTGLTRGAVSKLVDRLLKKELVIRSEANNDRRYQDIKLTSKAIKLVPQLAKLADENDHYFFSILTDTEKKSLVQLLKKLTEHHKLKKVPIA
ncbi:MAG: MarR family transcriptional regulator [Bacteriovoracaceae bacterium]